MRGYLGQHFAERPTRHGVFMDILGLGVLLTFAILLAVGAATLSFVFLVATMLAGRWVHGRPPW